MCLALLKEEGNDMLIRTGLVVLPVACWVFARAVREIGGALWTHRAIRFLTFLFHKCQFHFKRCCAHRAGTGTTEADKTNRFIHNIAKTCRSATRLARASPQSYLQSAELRRQAVALHPPLLDASREHRGLLSETLSLRDQSLFVQLCFFGVTVRRRSKRILVGIALALELQFSLQRGPLQVRALKLRIQLFQTFLTLCLGQTKANMFPHLTCHSQHVLPLPILRFH